MKAVILAGGFGTRLQDRVPDLPKPMAPVAGKPFLQYLLTQLISAGIEEITLSVGYLANSIRDHFQEDFRGTPLQYVYEDTPLGTGGALAFASRDFGDEPFLAINGDTFIDLEFATLVRWFCNQQAKTAMVLKEVPDVNRYGSIEVTDQIVTGFLEKGQSGPGLINAGVYMLYPGVFSEQNLSGAFSLENDFFEQHIERLRPAAYITSGWFIDIGVPEDYDRAQSELPVRFGKHDA